MSTPAPDRDAVIAALRTVEDPEIPVNLYDLGLIYELQIDGYVVRIVMTLTTPNCPVAETMPTMVREAVGGVPGVGDVSVELTWNPPWSNERISEDAKLLLEMMGIEWTESLAAQAAARKRITGISIGRTDRPS